jgi:hypothetical protein
MQTSAVPEHVFISFSSANKADVERITQDLQKLGIPVWVDYQGIAPGSPDWERVIRDALEWSYAVLLIASPSSAQSLAVRGELRIAQSRSVDIYPIWIDGDEWIDCAPLEFCQAQYIDCRSTNYDAGLRTIVAQLIRRIKEVTPSHYIASRTRNAASRTRNAGVWRRASWHGIDIPRNSILVVLPEASTSAGDDRAVIVNLLAYDSVQALLDDLYVNYLRELYEPFTYGSSWVLFEDSFRNGLVFVDWTWLAQRKLKTYDPPIELSRELPSRSLLTRSPWWTVTNANQLRVHGLAVHEELFLDLWHSDRKRAIYLEDFLEESEIDSCDWSKYRFLAVFEGRGCPGNDQPIVLRQIDRPLSDQEMARLVRRY